MLAAANRRTPDPVYSAHRWWARRPPAVMRGLVLAAATSSEASKEEFWSAYRSSTQPLAGLRVHDPFVGGGSTLVEAARLGAAVSGGDVDPLAVDIVKHELRPASADEVRLWGGRLLDYLRTRFSPLYPSDDAGRVPLHYFWLHEVTCPNCTHGGLLYKDLVLARDLGKNGGVVRNEPLVVFCPSDLSVHRLSRSDRTELRHLGRRWVLREGSYKGSWYTCEGCGDRSQHRDLHTGIAPRRLVAVESTATDSYRSFRSAQRVDTLALSAASRALADGVDLKLPTGRLSVDRFDNRPVSYGIEKAVDLFTERQLLVLGAATKWVDSMDVDASVKRALGLAISNALATNNKLCGYATDYGRLAPLFSVRGYSLPALAVELNPLHPDGGRGTLRRCIERVARSAASDVRRYVWSQKKKCVEPTQMDFRKANKVTSDIRVAGAADQGSGPETDLCIFDPPYFDFIAYSELSEFYRSWRDSPSTIQNSLLPRGDDPAEQFGLDLAACIRVAAKRLRAGRPIAFTYHSSNPEAWRAIGIALDDAKLAVTGLWPVRSDGHMGHHSQPGNCEWDLVVCCRRVTETTQVPFRASVAAWVKHLAPLRVGESDKVNMSLAVSMACTRYAVLTMGETVTQ